MTPGREPSTQAAIDQAIAKARAAGGDGIDTGDRPPPAPSAGDDDDVPEFVREIAARMPYADSDQTVGVLTDDKGEPLVDGRLISGADGPGNKGRGQPSPGLKPNHPISY